MAAPIYRDEFEKRLEDIFVRSIEYTNSVLDVQRIKTVRQISQEIGADTEKKLAAQTASFQDALNQQENRFQQSIGQAKQEILLLVDQRFQNVERRAESNEKILRAIAQALNITNI